MPTAASSKELLKRLSLSVNALSASLRPETSRELTTYSPTPGLSSRLVATDSSHSPPPRRAPAPRDIPGIAHVLARPGFVEQIGSHRLQPHPPPVLMPEAVLNRGKSLGVHQALGEGLLHPHQVVGVDVIEGADPDRLLRPVSQDA